VSRRTLAFLVTVLVAAAAAACQTSASPEASPLAPSASSPAPSVTAPGTRASGSLNESTGPSPAATAAIDPDWVTRPALTCGDNKRLFPPEALDGLGLGELGLDPAAAVLRATIADIPDYYPDSGWHRVLEGPDGVTFVARGNAETPWFEVTVGLLDGVLQPVIQGQCMLAIAAPTGITFARWWLDPDAPPPTAESTQIDILLREQACASGKPPEGRVLEPTIATTAAAIGVAIGIRQQGNADCPGNPAYSMRLELPEPIGARRLFDASQYPPRPVTAEDPG
jgi:hypothetical protein